MLVCTESDWLVHSQDKRAEAAIPCDCTAQAIVFYPGILGSSWKILGLAQTHPEIAQFQRGEVCAHYPAGLLLCWSRPSAGPHSQGPSSAPPKRLGNLPKIPVRSVERSSSACSDFRGRGRSSPGLAVLWVEFLPGLHPASTAFPAQPPRKP